MLNLQIVHRSRPLPTDENGEILMMKPVYTVQQFGAAFGVSRARFYQLVAEGKIKARKNGARTVVLAADAQAFVDGLPAFQPKMAD